MRTALVTLLLSLASFGCRTHVEPPLCTAARDCNSGEVCIDGACQACRSDADCEGRRCVEFRCTAEPDACNSSSECEPGLRCVDARCRTCTDASECETGICHASGRCEPPPCATDDACPEGELCDGGQCIAAGSEAELGACGAGTIHFARDSAKLSPTHQQRLSDARVCLLALVDRSLLVLEVAAAGDDALARRRAESLRGFLLGVGLPEAAMRVSVIDDGPRDAVRIVATQP